MVEHEHIYFHQLFVQRAPFLGVLKSSNLNGFVMAPAALGRVMHQNTLKGHFENRTLVLSQALQPLIIIESVSWNH